MEKALPKPRFTLGQRIFIFLASNVSYVLIYFIGFTLRWEIQGWEHWESVNEAGQRAILALWHSRLISAAYFWRNRGIVVLVSQHFDGEFIAQCLKKQGYDVVRGSSTRGGIDALRQLVKCLGSGAVVAFLSDGPKGPRYVAKVGPILLAKRTGHPVMCFNISVERKIQLKSWDRLEIPMPFTKALLVLAPPIYVPRNAGKDELKEKHAELQETLDQLREYGDHQFRVPS